MSQEDVELARRMIAWFNARDAEAAQAHSTDDVEIVPLRAAMEGTVYRGPEAFAAFGVDSEEAWEEIRFDPEALRDGGERVVAIWAPVGACAGHGCRGQRESGDALRVQRRPALESPQLLGRG